MGLILAELKPAGMCQGSKTGKVKKSTAGEREVESGGQRSRQRRVEGSLGRPASAAVGKKKCLSCKAEKLTKGKRRGSTSVPLS